MTQPLISFVAPTYNNIAWLPEMIQSILAQTIHDIELIIVNDGSTDGTKEFLDDWAVKDDRVMIVHNETNLGAGPSRNIGMNLAKADIIGVCDADDCYPVERAEITLEHFKKYPESELINYGYLSVGYNNEIVEYYDGKPFDHEDFVKTGQISYFCNPTVAYKKESGIEMGGYPKENQGMTDDAQFVKNWIQSGRKIDFQHGPYMCMHRVLPTSMMTKFRGFKPEWVTKK